MTAPKKPTVTAATALLSAANGTTPLASPPSTSGGKRKRASSTSTDSSQAEADSHTITQNSRKKRHASKDTYNAKYMASMCYSAHATRRHEAGLTKLPKDLAQAIEESLVEIFNEAKSGNIVEHIESAQNIFPLLARKAPFHNALDADLTEEFINDYNRICGGLDLLDSLAIDIRVDEELLNYLHDTVSSLHHDVAVAVMWHDILPYAPLSLMGLRRLRERITNTKEYRLLVTLLGSINDIERWLSLPSLRLEFSDHLKKIAAVAMQEETEKKLRKPEERGQAERAILNQPVGRNNEEVAKNEQQKAQKDLENARRLAEIQAEARRAKEKADRENKAAAQQEAKAAAEKKRKDAADAAEREKKKKQEEDEAREAAEAKRQKDEEAARATMQREKLRAEEEARHLQEVEAAKHEKQQQEEATKGALREELKKKARMQNDALRTLAVFAAEGQITSANLDWLGAPTKESCLQILSDLWNRSGARIATILPQQLREDSDILLEFDVNVILEARCAMWVLHHRGGSAQELNMTGWQLESMAQLQSRMRPFANQAYFSDLKVGVDEICGMLEEVQRATRAEAFDFLNSSTSTQHTQQTLNSSLGSSMTSDTTVNTEHDFFNQPSESQQVNIAPALMKAVKKVNPLLDPARTSIGPDGLPIPDANFVAQHNPLVYQSEDDHQPAFKMEHDHQSASERNTASTTKIRNPMKCKFGSNCNRGDDCHFTHPWDAVPDLPMDTPCTHYFRAGFCRYGSNCRLSHDVARFGAPGTHQQSSQSPTMEKLNPLDVPLGHRVPPRQSDPRSKIPCRDGEECTRQNCAFNHDGIMKPGVPRGPKPGRPGLGNSLLGAPRWPKMGGGGSTSFARPRPTYHQPHFGGALNRPTESSSDEDLAVPYLSERNNNNRRREQARVTTEYNGVKRERKPQQPQSGSTWDRIQDILKQNVKR